MLLYSRSDRIQHYLETMFHFYVWAPSCLSHDGMISASPQGTVLSLDQCGSNEHPVICLARRPKPQTNPRPRDRSGIPDGLQDGTNPGHQRDYSKSKSNTNRTRSEHDRRSVQIQRSTVASRDTSNGSDIMGRLGDERAAKPVVRINRRTILGWGMTRATLYGARWIDE